MDSHPLVITGMHRSCTSLVTQWLHTCGLYLGEHLLASSDSNEDGHFEDLEFLHIHQHILYHQGFPLSGLYPVEQIKPTEYDKAKIAAVLSVKNKLYPQWGWKEPRTCLFLDTYRELLPSAKYLIVFRDYHAVVSSLLKRDFAAIEKEYLSRNWFRRMGWYLFRRRQRMSKYYNQQSENFLKVWIAYNKAILHSLSGLPADQYLIVSYELLKQKSPEVFKFLTLTWGFKLNYHGFLTVYKERLISDTTDFMPYIKDGELVREADRINQQLSNLLKISSQLLTV